MGSRHRRTPAPTALREAVRGLVLAHGVLDDARRPCGTTISTPHAWALLELRGAPMTVGALAARLHIDRTNVSRLCRRMEEQGEVERRAHPDDARARLITLTEHGRAVARAVDASSAAHFERVLGRLDDPGAVIDALATLTAALTETS